jgi:23S rRNA (uracil-5-)-methyltransferase RumA
MRVSVEKIIYPGKSLSKIGGRVVLSDEGLPGEMIEVTPLKEKKSYIEAETKKILNASPHRVAFRCSHYKTCSPYQYIEYPFQLEIKKSQVREMLSHSLKIDLGDIVVKPSPKIWGYRNRVRFRIIRENDTPFLAYHQPGFEQEFVKVEECHLISERMNSFLKEILEIIRAKRLKGIKEVELRESASNGQMIFSFHVDYSKSMKELPGLLSPLKSKFPLKGVVCLIKNKKSLEEVVLDGENFIEEKVGENIFHLGPQSFFQINIDLLREFIEDLKKIIPLSGKETIADLYCGVGTFGITLAQKAKEVIGVESSAENIRFLKKNLALNHAENFRVCEGLSDEWMPRILKRRMDVLIFDPPRKGLDGRIVDSLVQNPVPLVIYISCNPSTLIRDLKLLLSRYELKDLRLYDFFPHTPHIETCTLLEKKG